MVFYKLPSYPAIIGMEGVGVIEKLGSGVQGLSVGDRVGYGVGPMGAYAQVRTIPATKVVKLPEGVASEIAAAAMLKGLTAHFLTQRTFIVNSNHTILVHAAAGGVGALYLPIGKGIRCARHRYGRVGRESKTCCRQWLHAYDSL